MIKRIHRFNTQTEQNNYMGGDDYVEPHLSLCEDNEIVRYNNHPLRQYLTFEILKSGTIGWNLSNSSATECTIEYSINDGDWVEITSTTSGVTFSVSTGDIVRFRGDNSRYATSTSYYNYFTSTCNFNVYGNIMSLIDSDNFSSLTTLSSSYTFYSLFKSCTTLISAKRLLLPATTLASYCYQYMFRGCTSLTSAPALPATTLANYCYIYMFCGCTSLTTAPELPATTLATYCYDSMFRACSSLTSAPALPATTLASYCYTNMFCACRSLTSAPALPATTLVGGCYEYMFYNCSNLNYIKALFTTTPSTSYTSNWVYGVASTGTFVKNTSATWNVTGVHGIPSNWTVATASA